MGSGSSRSSRALRRLRGPDSRPAGPGGAAREDATGPLASATAVTPEATPEAAGAEAGGAAGPDAATPLDSRDETLRLLDQLLAESAAWGPGELPSRGPTRARPAAGTGSRVSPKQRAEDHPESSVSEAPDSGHKRPERQSVILYDYSEEELMASIEQEYCR
ncbi:cystin-1 [Molossus molossus]|uniref:Cystin 1 n=1 Tax=Molossus molossus TaxID=27622 RepID=A0A7J8E1D8_MOLMO|nr:cystin-1 [Molossus molossus]KAF6429170.1 cystin 1 [Molossus molossus]